MSATSPAKPAGGDAPAAERVVESIGAILAAVPSLPTALQAWGKLGFLCGGQFVFQGCRAADIGLTHGAVRFLSPDVSLPPTPLGEAVGRKLGSGSGLVGWTWDCRSTERSRVLVERAGGTRFRSDESGSKTFMVPEVLTAGALTYLTQSTPDPAPVYQPNAVDRIDHVVLMVGDAEATAAHFGKLFGLNPRTREMKNARYAFCKVGETVIEIVGPEKPNRSDRSGGRVWGVTFGSHDLDHSIARIRANGVKLPDPHPAIQGGRIVSVPGSVGGVQIAFIGK